MNLIVDSFRKEHHDTKYRHYVRDAMAVSLAMLPPDKFMVKVQRLTKESIKGNRQVDPDSPTANGTSADNAFTDGEGVSAADELVRALRPIEQKEALACEANSLYCVLKALCKFGGRSKEEGPHVDTKLRIPPAGWAGGKPARVIGQKVLPYRSYKC